MTEDLKQGSKLGDNELMLRIGRGGMATVWVARERAKDPKDDRLVAVKAMLLELADENEFVTMFLDEVRLVRAINSFSMPKFMERDEIAKADFAWLWQKVEAKPAGLKDDLKQNAALFYGGILKKQKRIKEAIEVWNKGITFNPGSDLAREIRQELK